MTDVYLFNLLELFFNNYLRREVEVRILDIKAKESILNFVVIVIVVTMRL